MTEFEKAVLAELKAIREAIVAPASDALSEFMAEPSPRTIDEWYEGVLTRNLSLEGIDE